MNALYSDNTCRKFPGFEGNNSDLWSEVNEYKAEAIMVGWTDDPRDESKSFEPAIYTGIKKTISGKPKWLLIFPLCGQQGEGNVKKVWWVKLTFTLMAKNGGFLPLRYVCYINHQFNSYSVQNLF